jgi:hypothetical protein
MRRLLLAIALALGASAAQADNGSFYLGAGISKDKLSDIVNAGTNFADIDSTSWKVYAGLRPLSVFAIEADYLDLGSQTNRVPPGVGTCPVGGCPVFHSDAKAFAGYAVGFLPIPLPFLDVFGKAGLARWKLNGSSLSPLAPPSSFSNSGTEFAWGVGTQVHVGNFGARLEYENFRIPGTNGANVVSLEVFLNAF